MQILHAPFKMEKKFEVYLLSHPICALVSLCIHLVMCLVACIRFVMPCYTCKEISTFVLVPVLFSSTCNNHRATENFLFRGDML
jgi:hypothetical protein